MGEIITRYSVSMLSSGLKESEMGDELRGKYTTWTRQKFNSPLLENVCVHELPCVAVTFRLLIALDSSCFGLKGRVGDKFFLFFCFGRGPLKQRSSKGH